MEKKLVPFRKEYKAKVGDIVENAEGKRFLIGEVNKGGGVCDHCADIRYGERVRVIGNLLKDKELVFELS